MIKVSEIVLHEADEPCFVRDLLYSDLLAGEDCAQVDFPSLVTDRPQLVTLADRFELRYMIGFWTNFFWPEAKTGY